MNTNLYTIDIVVNQRVEVEAETLEEAEEAAFDEFIDHQRYWYDVEFYVVEVEEYEDDAQTN